MHNNSRNAPPKSSTYPSHILPSGPVNYLQKTRPDPTYDPDLMREDCSEPPDVSIWMPFYWGDYFRDTGHLTCEEHGAYFRLIGHCWIRGGKLVDDDARLALLLGLSLAKWRKMRATIAEFFQIKDGFWSHKRIHRELESARKNREKRSKAGKKGADKRWQSQCDGNDSANANALPTQCPSPVPVPSSPSLTGLVYYKRQKRCGGEKKTRSKI